MSKLPYKTSTHKIPTAFHLLWNDYDVRPPPKVAWPACVRNLRQYVFFKGANKEASTNDESPEKKQQMAWAFRIEDIIHQADLLSIIQISWLAWCWNSKHFFEEQLTLVGGFNPFENSQIRNLPQIGVNIKITLKPPPSNLLQVWGLLFSIFSNEATLGGFPLRSRYHRGETPRMKFEATGFE